MRDRAYELAAIVAWPALVWCLIEASLRVASGYSTGAWQLALTGGCAAATIAAVRLRRAQLAVVAVRAKDCDRR